jgi:hypothetical protein
MQADTALPLAYKSPRDRTRPHRQPESADVRSPRPETSPQHRACPCCLASGEVWESGLDRVFFDQRSDQSQKFLLFRAVSSAEEFPDLDVCDMAARSQIGLVADEHNAGCVAYQVPPVAIGTAIPDLNSPLT